MSMKWSAMIVGLLVSGLVSGQQVYKSVDKDGNVTYSSEPAPGADSVEAVTIEAGPTAAEQREAAARAEKIGQAADRAGAEKAARGPTKSERVESARRDVEAAEARLNAAKVVGPGDRQGTAGGGSRFSESYQQRVTAAEAERNAAQQRLKDAQRARP